MDLPSRLTRRATGPFPGWVVWAVGLWLIAGGVGYAQSEGPFERLAGHWSGAGTIELANGAREPIRCRASYDVLGQQDNLQFNIRCASDSFSFDLRGSANHAAGAITGTWSEATRNASGTMSGNANADRFEVVAKGANFSATMTLTTQGDRQSVTIKSQDAKADVKGASITLRRG